MLRILLGLAALIAFGIILPKQHAAQPDQSAQQGTPVSQSVAVVEVEPKPSEYYRACGEHQEYRSSDLCAQWQAADAAQSAASAAWLVGIAGALISVFTLLIAMKAAGYAKEAADHTASAAGVAGEGNKIAKDIGMAQTRSYLSIVCRSFTYDEEHGWFDFEFAVTNSGQSPARRVSIYSEMFYPKDPKFGGVQHMDTWTENPGDLASGQTHTWPLDLDAFTGHPVLRLENPGGNHFTVRLTATYKTVFDEIDGNDVFSFQAILPPDGRDLRMRPIQEGPQRRTFRMSMGSVRKRGEPAAVGINHGEWPKDA